MKKFSLLAALFILLPGCAERKEKTLGADFGGLPIAIVAAKQTNQSTTVILRGTMIDKCPVAGCWFMLRDESGTIKVDTKNSGFVVVNVPLMTQVTVNGIAISNGAERYIDASGVRY